MAFDTLFQALDFDPKPVSAWPKFALPEAVGRANHGIEIPLEVLQEALKSVLLPGGRMRAVRPMASAEEAEAAAAEVPPPAAAN
jgi:hypothetical protein